MTESPAYRVAPGADIAEDAEIGEGSAVWHLAQVREGARLGRDCVVGRGAYIGSGVRMGDGCKVQNHALVYEPAELAAGVFVGPAAVFTNDHFPRAVTPDLRAYSQPDICSSRRRAPNSSAGAVSTRDINSRRASKVSGDLSHS